MTLLCACGCQEPAPPPSHGVVRRFRAGHNFRLRKPIWRYLPEDRGYTTPCWVWFGTIDHRGYPQTAKNGKTARAHRVIYEALVGAIPEGLTLDHLCRVKACVNPAHLEPVTRGENTLRGTSPTALNARKTVCLNGHPFDRIRPDGARTCRQCRARRGRETRQRAAVRRALLRERAA